MRIRWTLFGPVLLAITGLTCAPQAPPGATSADPVEPPAPVVDSEPQAVRDRKHLQQRIDAVLKDVNQRDLLTTHAFWTIFDGVLGLGPDVLLLDPATGKRLPAVEQIAQGKGLRGLEFIETPQGVDVVTQAGSGVGQGHQDQ